MAFILAGNCSFCCVVVCSLPDPFSVSIPLMQYIHTYIRLLTTSPKELFSANYKEKDKNKNMYKLFKVTIANH